MQFWLQGAQNLVTALKSLILLGLGFSFPNQSSVFAYGGKLDDVLAVLALYRPLMLLERGNVDLQL